MKDSTLAAIDHHFHGLIRKRAGHLLDDAGLELPLPSAGDAAGKEMWFPVPGMYGGFSYRLEGEGDARKLVVASWCRVVEGSERCHEITAEGCRLLDEDLC